MYTIHCLMRNTTFILRPPLSSKCFLTARASGKSLQYPVWFPPYLQPLALSFNLFYSPKPLKVNMLLHCHSGYELWFQFTDDRRMKKHHRH